MSTRQSAADRVGGSSAFGRAAQARSIRHQLIADVTGEEETVAGPPASLELHEISTNPDNPRETLAELEGLAASLTEIGQVQAITVATVDAYLEHRPGRARELEPGARYVVVDGHRRLAAAREAGLGSLRVTVNDALAATDEALLEAAFVANAQRENLSDLEEAQALTRLVELYGSQHKAARRLGVTQAYISQRLSLLALAPDLQADLEAGRRKVEHVRGLARLSHEEQRETADQRAADQRAAGSRRRGGAGGAGGEAEVAAGAVPGSQPVSLPVQGAGRTDNGVIGGGAPGAAQGDNGVIGSGGPGAGGSGDNGVISGGGAGGGGAASVPDAGELSSGSEEAAGDNGVIGSAAAGAGGGSGDNGVIGGEGAREAGSGDNGVIGESGWDPNLVDIRKLNRMPWHDGDQVADLVFEKMGAEPRAVLLARLLAASEGADQ
ncbi:ParB/RepB/Spo0J family partition protein [Streptomyces sp. NPDC097619]|uniref:ParB/RepB/Spo0J family partition protein n=1 Tax=Streptomyces sp. NPDC097619 TaxID=3157228 RepID=UPI00331AB7A4